MKNFGSRSPTEISFSPSWKIFGATVVQPEIWAIWASVRFGKATDWRVGSAMRGSLLSSNYFGVACAVGVETVLLATSPGVLQLLVRDVPIGTALPRDG